MKYFGTFALVCLLMFGSGSARATTITTTVNVGNPFDFTFSNLPLMGSGYQDQGGVTVNFFNLDQLDFGDVIRLELFDGLDFSTPVIGLDGRMAVFEFSSPTDHFGVSMVERFLEVDGGIRLTALAGSVVVESLQFRQHRGGNLYGKDFTVSTTAEPSPVPLPGSVWLLLTGLVALFSLKYHRRFDYRSDSLLVS